MDSGWMRATIGLPGSRTGSVRSFNTNYGRQSPENSPHNQRAQVHNQNNGQVSPQQQQNQQQQQQEFLRQQEEYRRQQQELAERQAAQEAEAQRQYEEQLRLQKQQAELQAAQAAQESPVRQNVRDIINRYEPDIIERHIQNGDSVVQQRIEQTRAETKPYEQVSDGRKSPGAVSNKSSRYKSTISLHDLGLDNYPYPEYAEGTKP